MKDEDGRSSVGPGMLAAAICGASLIVFVVGLAFMTSRAASPRTAAASAPVPPIEIENFKFTPATVTIPVGTTVVWVNRDDAAHTVTGNDGRLASVALHQGRQFSYQFTAPGTYAYHCTIHPQMTGQVVVE